MSEKKYKVDDLLKNNFFCTDPWTELGNKATGQWALCCVSKALPYKFSEISPLEHYHSDVMNNIRNEMLEPDVYGTKHIDKYCIKCKKIEEMGGRSHRNGRNHIFQYDKDFKEKFENIINGNSEYLFRRLDFKIFGNLCNLKCVMCVPHISSSIAQEMKEHGEFDGPILSIPFNDLTPEKQKKFWDDMYCILKNTKCVKFTGGEPLLNKLHYSIIQFAIDNGFSEHIELEYISNLTRLPSEKSQNVLEMWKKFKLVDIKVSIEAVGKKNDYIRYESNWNDILNNIEILKNNNIITRVTSTVGNYNIYELLELRKFTENNLGIDFNANSYVYQPFHIAPQVLPQELKNEITEYYTKNDTDGFFKNQIEFMNNRENDELNWSKFKAYIDSLNIRRNIWFFNYFPYFEKYWSYQK